MNNLTTKNDLLDNILQFCIFKKMAESTFGRQAVNDGKFVSRLRSGARVTPETWHKVQRFIKTNGGNANSSLVHVPERN